MWRSRIPSRFDFIGDYETFLPFSCQAVLSRMGYITDLTAARGPYRTHKSASARCAEIFGMLPQALKELPSHRDLINQIVQGAPAQAGQRMAR